jgi:hypothetical protein
MEWGKTSMRRLGEINAEYPAPELDLPNDDPVLETIAGSLGQRLTQRMAVELAKHLLDDDPATGGRRGRADETKPHAD